MEAVRLQDETDGCERAQMLELRLRVSSLAQQGVPVSPTMVPSKGEMGVTKIKAFS